MSNGNNHGKPPRGPQGGPPPVPRQPRLDDVRPIEHRTLPRTGPGQHGAGQVVGRAAPGPRTQTGRIAARAGAHHPQAAPRRRSTFATVALVTLVGLGVLAALAAAFVVFAPPVEFIRQQAVAAVKKETGRDLVIRGPATFTLYPQVGVSLADVSLSAPPGMGGAPTVAMQRLDVAVKLMPLLERRVEVKQLVLTRPAFDLRVDRNGRASWDMAALAKDPEPLRFAAFAGDPTGGSTTLSDAHGGALVIAQTGTGNRPTSGARAGSKALDDFALEDVRIIGGSAEYSDDRNGARQRLTSIDANVTAASVASPLKVKGDADWQGQTVTFDGTLTSLAGLLRDKRARLAIDVKSRPLEANYTGALDISSGATLDGNVNAKAASLRAFAQWIGHNLPDNDGFGPLAISGRLRSEPTSISLDNADISLDGMRAVGRIAAALGEARPQVKADLKIAELNLNTYIGSGGGDSAPAAAASASPKAKPAPADTSRSEPPAPRSIEDLIERQGGPRVKGYTARHGWSDEPMDLALLDLADADAKLSVGKLIVRDITVGQSDLVLALKGRVARTTFERVQLYEGTGRGNITLDAAAATPKIAASIVVDGIAAMPLLKDAAAIDWLSGRGKVTLALTGEGATQRQLVAKLNGRAEANFTDGAITGFNVGKVVRGLGQGKLTGLQSSAAEKTDFSQLSATFDIVDGIATNQDLTLLSPFLRVTGGGRVMLPDRQIDYTVRPKIVSDTSGQGGAIDLAGIEVPVRISGDWERPSFAPDLSKVDAGQAVKAVEQIGKSLKGKNADEIVDDLFGKDTKESQKAKKFLDKLFR